MAGEVWGTKSVFKLSTLALPSTLVDISRYLDAASLPQNLEQAEVTAFGDAFAQFISGLSDSQIPLGGNWDDPIGIQLALLNISSVAVTWEYGPNGAVVASGQPKFSGSARVIGFTHAIDITAAQTFTANLQQAGAVTHGVY
jgi:hypothetical protein